MKTVFALSILFCAIALPALAELTVQDIEKIDPSIRNSDERIHYPTSRQLENPCHMVNRDPCRNNRDHRAPIGNSDNFFRMAEHKGQLTRETD